MAIPLKIENGIITEFAPSDGVDSGMNVIGGVYFESYLSPPALSAHQNNYNPTGLATSSVLRLTTTGANYDITGIVKNDCQLLAVVNAGTSGNIRFKNNSANSLADNRFLLNADATLAPNEGCIIWYDCVSLRWRIVSRF